MKNLIKHLLENNFEEILEKSLLNCHAEGLHSLMLLDCPGKTIRLYVAEKGNTLWQNDPSNYAQGMSIGFHAHHCNLTLECIKGHFHNWIVKEDDGDIRAIKYLYQSKIINSDMCFKKIKSDVTLKTKSIRSIKSGEFASMRANELHTVICNPNIEAAWLVYEGKKDKNYIPYCYSTSELMIIDSDHLYKKPEYIDIIRLIKISGILN